MLTVGNEAQGGILDALQRRVDLEHVSNVLGALHVEIIARDAANEGMITTSAGGDSRLQRMGQRTRG